MAYLTRSVCDSSHGIMGEPGTCKRTHRSLGVMHEAKDGMGLDTPVLFLCAKCDPHNFRAVSTRSTEQRKAERKAMRAEEKAAREAEARLTPEERAARDEEKRQADEETQAAIAALFARY